MSNTNFQITLDTILYSIPLELAEKLILGESDDENFFRYAGLYNLIRDLDFSSSMTTRAFETLDNIYRIVFLKLLTQKKELAELEEFKNHLSKVSQKVSGTILDDSGVYYSTYWNVYIGFIEDRISTFENNNIDKVLSMNHVLTILEMLQQDGEVNQSLLIDKIPKMKKANLSRILNIMERNGLIEKRKIGHNNFISLGISAPKDLNEYNNLNSSTLFANDKNFDNFIKGRETIMSLTQQPIVNNLSYSNSI